MLAWLILISPLLSISGACGGAAPLAAFAAEDPKPAPTTHSDWTAVLERHAKTDGFDYAGLKKERTKLDAYVVWLERVTADQFTAWSLKEQFAFWINAYNAYTVRRVVDAYPIKSIKDLGDEKLSVWDRELIPLGALAPELKKAKLTLNDVENLILRPKFKDARVHAAINCASKGCPALRNEAFTADKLDTQLSEQVRRWLKDEKRNRFDPKQGPLQLSQIFDWFKADFEREAGSPQAWIAKQLPDEASALDNKKKYTITYFEYSWELNDAR